MTGNKPFKQSKLQRFIIFIVILTLALSFSIGYTYAVGEPTFQSISVSTSNASPGDTVTVTVYATGVSTTDTCGIAYISPKGAFRFMDLSYDSTSGKLTGTFTVDNYDVPGVWKVAFIGISGTFIDGDVTDLSAGDITVVNPNPDVTPPTFSSLQLSTTQTNPGGKVHIAVDASDSESGLDGALITWVCGLDSIDALVPFNEKTGKLEGDIYIPLDVSAGTYTLDSILIADKQANEYTWSAATGSAITGKNLVLSDDPNAPVAGFVDVHADDWFAKDVLFLAQLEVLGGYADGTFRPASNVTRAEFAKMVCQASGWELIHPATPSFSDVPSSNWAYDYIETAKAHGVISGYPDGLFKPNNNITRAEICKMLITALNIDIDVSGTAFSDVPSTYWAMQYIMTARNCGIVSGYTGNIFKPAALATRAEAAKMISNAFLNPGQ